MDMGVIKFVVVLVAYLLFALLPSIFRVTVHSLINTVIMFHVILVVVAISLVLLVGATPHIHQIRHSEIAQRHATNVQLYKRYSGARWTFYATGLFVVDF